MNTSSTGHATASGSTLGARVGGLDFVAVRDGLWRVVLPDGAVRGHIERFDATDGVRFSARRSLGGARVLPLGEFWSAQGAADCFA